MKSSGFGKVILFNEHFVVYGIPAIASSINSKTVARIEPLKRGWTLEDKRNANPGYKAEKSAQQKESIERMFKEMNFNVAKNPIKIILEGDLKAVGGVGASAASCVAIARAISEKFNFGFDDERINEIAYEGEKAYAGNPSGIDNTVATYGGLIWFVKDGTQKMERLSLKKPVEIVMGNTGLTTDTKAAVDGVKNRKEKNPGKYNSLFRQAEELVFKARDALLSNDLKKVGALMNENHKLLQEIGVSHKKLDKLIEIARKAGALGAKMTGGGLGGYMIALTPGKDLQEKVAKAMGAKGFEVLRTKIGV